VRRLIENATEQNLETALDHLVLHPLGIDGARLATRRGDLAGVLMGETADYDPRWVYHGLLVGPLRQAALLLDRLMSGNLLPPDLKTAMLECHPVGGPIAGRPWTTPGYALGLMSGGHHQGRGDDRTYRRRPRHGRRGLSFLRLATAAYRRCFFAGR
jgi:hypothetical protein